MVGSIKGFLDKYRCLCLVFSVAVSVVADEKDDTQTGGGRGSRVVKRISDLKASNQKSDQVQIGANSIPTFHSKAWLDYMCWRGVYKGHGVDVEDCVLL